MGHLVLLAAIIYLVMGGVTFIAFWIDKRAAMRGRWRIPESTLHILELLGGIGGALAAQRILRHKSYKYSYRFVLWLIIAIHLIGWAAVAWRMGK